MNCSKCDKPAKVKGLCTTHYQAQWFQDNKERALARIRKHRAAKKAADPEYREHIKEKNKEWKRRPHARYLTSKNLAAKKKLSFTLTKEQYLELIDKPCYYCNGYFGKVETNIGLDRIDSNLGYDLDNVVSCCTFCNQTKNGNLTLEETKAVIALVIQMRTNEKE